MRFIIGIIAAALLLAACDKAPPPPLVFGASVRPGYEPIYLARELGYFSKTNLRLAEPGDAAAVRQALRDHTLHVAAVTLGEALQLRRDIPDLKIFLLLDSSSGAGVENSAPGKVFDVLVARDDDVGQHLREMVELLHGWQRALDYLHTDPDKAMQIMAKREHMNAAQFGEALRGFELLGLRRNGDLLLGEPPAVGASVEATQRFMLERGLISVGADTSALLDTGLLAEAMK